MMLIEQTQVSDVALPVAEFRDHLQLGSGFADDGMQDSVLIAQLRAALAAVQAETGKALFSRSFKYVLTAWRGVVRQPLPVAPVTAIQSLEITDLGDGVEVIDPGAFRLEQDFQTPALRWRGWALPTIPVGGTAEIVFDAGFGAAWTDIPADLRQAVFLLATHYYENRSASTERSRPLPLGVGALLAAYKPVRLFGGGRR